MTGPTDVRDLLAHAAASPEPSAWDLDLIVRRGDAARRRRRTWTTSAVVAALVLGAAVLVGVPNLSRLGAVPPASSVPTLPPSPIALRTTLPPTLLGARPTTEPRVMVLQWLRPWTDVMRRTAGGAVLGDIYESGQNSLTSNDEITYATWTPAYMTDEQLATYNIQVADDV
ncbi:MAG: hypothetical protein ABI468_01935, partial [Candidatus Nanopelagicales bacterium]